MWQHAKAAMRIGALIEAASELNGHHPSAIKI